MGIRMCRKGKSCGATCIDPRERCNLELGPLVSSSVSKVSLNLGAIFLKQIEAGKAKQPKSLPSDLRKQLFALPGPKNTLEEARARHSAAQKGRDPEERWAARKGLAEAERKAGIQQKPVEPRNLDRSPGAETRTAPRVRRELANIAESAKKGEMTLMMDDISRIMRGSIPENIQAVSAENNEALPCSNESYPV